MNKELLTKNFTQKDTKDVLISALKEMQAELATRSEGTLDLKGEALKKEKTAVVEAGKKAVESNKVGDAIASFSALVVDTLSALEEKITVKSEEFEAIVAAIDLKSKELAELTGIEGKIITLAELIDTEKALRKAFEEEKAIAIADKKAELAELNATIDAREEEVEAEREKEEEEFIYNRDRARKLEEDEYQDKRKVKEKELVEREEAVAIREVTIKGREEYLEKLEETVAGIPAKEAAALEEGKKLGKKEADTSNAFEVRALKASQEADKKLADAEIRMLKETITRLEKENAEFKAANKDAVDQVKAIATSAVEAAGNARMVSTLEGIASAKETSKK